MRELGGYIGLLFSFKAKALMDTRFLWYLGNYGIVLLFACVLACPIYPWICRKTSALSGKKGFVLSAFIGIVVLLLFILSTAYMVSDTYNPFLYFRF